MISSKQNILLIVSILLIAFKGYSSDLFDKGVAAYNEKDYALSAISFEEHLATNPNDIPAYYNLGLAHMENKNFGLALWAFEKVLKASPKDEVVQEHIIICYNELFPNKEWSPTLNSLEAGLYSVSSNIWAYLAISFSIIFCVFFVLFKKTKSITLKKLSLVVSFGSLIIFIFCGFISRQSYKFTTETNLALVTQKTIATFDELGVTAISNLKEGTYLIIEEGLSNEVIRVTTLDGEEYHVKSTDISTI